MKKIRHYLLAITVAAIGVVVGALAAGPAMAGTGAGTGITGSMHDINAYAVTHTGVAKDNEGRVCVFCHTPHHASTDAALGYNPLWSHKTTTATYTPYKSATFDIATYGGVDPLTGPSRLCMSCHDGVTAVDDHSFTTDGNSSATYVLSGSKVVGNATMSTDHPIGFDYNLAQQANPTGVYPATNTWAGGSAAISKNLFNGSIMTCATCHDVHNKDNVIQDKGADNVQYNWLLRAKQTGSAICLSCHNK